MWGTFHFAKAAFRHLQAAGARGRFIVVTSRAGMDGSRERPLYATVKGAHEVTATFLNEVRIARPTPIRSGDTIRVGNSVLRFGERVKKKGA